MICPTCSAAGQVSEVRDLRCDNGKLPKDHFFDATGQEHFHNPNVVVTEFQCSNGHRFAERSSWQCHVCGYKVCDAEIVVGEAPVATVPATNVRREPGVPAAVAKKRKAKR